MPKTHKPYPAEFRADAVRLVRAGTPLSRVARDLDVSSKSLRHWVKQTDLDSGRRQDGLTSEEREELRKLRREKPLRYVVRVADRSCGPAPICVAASASINRCIACSRTRRNTSVSAPWSCSSSAGGIILFWAIVGLLVWVRASKRTPRWPFLSTSSAALGSPRIYTTLLSVIPTDAQVDLSAGISRAIHVAQSCGD